MAALSAERELQVTLTLDARPWRAALETQERIFQRFGEAMLAKLRGPWWRRVDGPGYHPPSRGLAAKKTSRRWSRRRG